MIADLNLNLNFFENPLSYLSFKWTNITIEFDIFISSRKSSIMSELLTVHIPAFEFQANLVVYPLPDTAVKTVSLNHSLELRLIECVYRVVVISFFSKKMLSTQKKLEVPTGWSFCLTMSIA